MSKLEAIDSLHTAYISNSIDLNGLNPFMEINIHMNFVYKISPYESTDQF